MAVAAPDKGFQAGHLQDRVASTSSLPAPIHEGYQPTRDSKARDPIWAVEPIKGAPVNGETSPQLIAQHRPQLQGERSEPISQVPASSTANKDKDVIKDVEEGMAPTGTSRAHAGLEAFEQRMANHFEMAVELAADLTDSDPSSSNTPFEVVGFVVLSTAVCSMCWCCLWVALAVRGYIVVKRRLGKIMYSTVPSSAASPTDGHGASLVTTSSDAVRHSLNGVSV